MSLSSFFSSLLPVVHADAPEEKEEEQPKEEETAEEEGGEAEAEEEEEEPEDILPALREECEQSTKCAPSTKHFQHCEERVNSGQGYKHEECVEEFMMHCVDGCVAPKLFSKLK